MFNLQASSQQAVRVGKAELFAFSSGKKSHYPNRKGEVLSCPTITITIESVIYHSQQV